MTYREYLKSIGMTDDQIKAAETAFGPELIAKAFESPLKAQAAAEAATAAAVAERAEFERFYNEDVLPKVSSVYQDAINQRTRSAALEERLKAAKEYGFLADPKTVEGAVPGMPPGNPVVANPVPGSPAAPGAPASPGAPDPR